MLRSMLQGLKNYTGYGSQAAPVARPTDYRGLLYYRGSLDIHRELGRVLNWERSNGPTRCVYNNAGRNSFIPDTGVGSAFRVTVIIQLYHGTTNSVLRGANGHVSMLVWSVNRARNLYTVNSFHVAFVKPNQVTLNTCLFPRRLLNPAHAGQTDFTEASREQDVWFYTLEITAAQAQNMIQRMQHHYDNVAHYRNDAFRGTRRNNYYTCLTMVDDVLKAARLSSAGPTSWGSPYNYSYGFVRWNCSYVPNQKMVHFVDRAWF